MKLLIADRDGVINYDSDQYIKSPDEWEPIHSSLEAIALLTRSGYRVVVTTNQAGIDRGLFTVETLNAIHDKMHKAIRKAGGCIDAVFYCPHSPEAGCDCRKPKPGMLKKISAAYNTPLRGIPVVGDSIHDLQAATSVGAQPILVLTGYGKLTYQNGELPPGTKVFPDLLAVATHLSS